MDDSMIYGNKFNITYQTFESDGLTPVEKINLNLGENHLSLAKEKVSLTRRRVPDFKNHTYNLGTVLKL